MFMKILNGSVGCADLRYQRLQHLRSNLNAAISILERG